MDDTYLRKIVNEDFAYLQSKWKSEIDEGEIRRSSPILRRFIYEDLLGQAWRANGFKGEPQLKAYSVLNSLSGIPLENVEFASAGGAYTPRVTVQGAMFLNIALTTDQIQAQAQAGPPVPQNITLQGFKDSICIIIDGVKINRSQLIRYVANKMGGVHFDPRRDFNKEKLESVYKLLDQAFKNIEVAGKNSILYEVLAIWTSIVESEDIQRMCRQ